jgi:uncharacterized protein YcaQ
MRRARCAFSLRLIRSCGIAGGSNNLWGWAYRFEAYVPERNRRRGYYAMPLLWMDRVIGWVNCTGTDDRLEVRAGFVGGKPKERDFRQAFEHEVARMELFLSPVRKGPRLSAL